MSIYLDHNATCPPDPEVVEAMLPYLQGRFGNPSSIHGFGQQARRGVDLAREQVARLIGAEPEEIVFTSGGTEANNLAILGGFAANRDTHDHIVVSPLEHQAVLGPIEQLERHSDVRVTRLEARENGAIDLSSMPKRPNTATLISVMTANNDTGVIQPIEKIVPLARELGAILHSDAVQAVGKLPFDVHAMGIDLLSFSSHKLYGPKGAGALFVRRGTHLLPQVFGGHQETGRRAGTENVAAIVGFGCACAIAERRLTRDIAHMTRLRDRLAAGIEASIEDVEVFGRAADRIANTLNVGFGDIEGDTLVMALDLKGVAVSTGSACLSESKTLSHVLTAMGAAPRMVNGSVRFSLGRHNTTEEVDTVIALLEEWAPRLRCPSGGK